MVGYDDEEAWDMILGLDYRYPPDMDSPEDYDPYEPPAWWYEGWDSAPDKD